MNLKKYNCNQRNIKDFVENQLGADKQALLETHLTECEPCRALLANATAHEEYWSKAANYLQDDANELLPLSRSSSADSKNESRTLSVQQVLELLAPTDDPNMLGRLGEYEISGVVGAGGMGAVLKGFDRSLNRVVAIKVMAPHLASSATARKRFAREAQAAAAMTHDNVIDIYGVSEATGLPYLVMPYVRGPSLQKRIDQEGTLSVVEVLRIGHQVASGLAAAHQQGLVHRDIKPANIILQNDGIERLVITDFGLARAVDDASVTRTGVIAGTPQFMSPEQARGEAVDHRSDLFSLGSVLYAACTGRPPFRAESTFGMLRRITDNEPRAIREITPEIPEWLCQVIRKLHAKSPDDRYPSAEEVAGLMQKCLAHVQTPNTPLPAELQSQARNKKTLLAITVAIAGLLMGGMLLVNSNKSPVKPRQTKASAPVHVPSTSSVETIWESEIDAETLRIQLEAQELAAESEHDFAAGSHPATLNTGAEKR